MQFRQKGRAKFWKLPFLFARFHTTQVCGQFTAAAENRFLTGCGKNNKVDYQLKKPVYCGNRAFFSVSA